MTKEIQTPPDDGDQDPQTVIPNASIFVLMAMYSAIAKNDTKLAKAIQEKLTDIVNGPMGKDYPGSVELAKVIVHLGDSENE